MSGIVAGHAMSGGSPSCNHRSLAVAGDGMSASGFSAVECIAKVGVLTHSPINRLGLLTSKKMKPHGDTTVVNGR